MQREDLTLHYNHSATLAATVNAVMGQYSEFLNRLTASKAVQCFLIPKLDHLLELG